MNSKSIKKIFGVISFVSFTLIIVFFAQTAYHEIDNSILRVLGTFLWLGMSLANGVIHGALFSKLQ